MTYLIILGIYFAVLAGVGIVSRRRLGSATLALAAGALLASYWASTLTPVVARSGFALTHPPLYSIVTVVLTLTPAMLLLLRAPKAATFLHSLVSSLIFAAFAVVLTYPAFEKAVVMEEPSQAIIGQFTGYFPMVATVCIVMSIIEVFLHKKKKHSERDKKHRK